MSAFSAHVDKNAIIICRARRRGNVATLETGDLPAAEDVVEQCARRPLLGYNRIVKHVGRIAFGFQDPGQPTPPGTVGLHPPITARAVQNQAPPR